MKELTPVDYPLQIAISFKKLFEVYTAKLDDANPLAVDRIEKILKISQKYPRLSEGIETIEELEEYRPQIDDVLEDVFASVLESNEIKIATLPFTQTIFKSSQRYKNIIKAAGKDFNLELKNFDDNQFYIMGCSVILNAFYGYHLDFRRPFYYGIPDAQNIIRHYRVLYNGDFIDLKPTDRAKEITQEDVSQLLDNFNNIDLWKEKFPPGSWKFKGFVIANLYDATTDVSLSNFKTNLLQIDQKTENFATQFETIVQAVFNLPDLRVGYSIYNREDNAFEHPPEQINVKSYILDEKNMELCKTALCSHSYNEIFVEQKSYCISDVDRYLKSYPENTIYKKLHHQRIKSAIITPIISDGIILGTLEIVSPHSQELNSINANKLEDIMPFLADSVKRNEEKSENEIELLIQEECTSIHKSVHWKFRREAKRVLKRQYEGEDASFREIVFEDVYPLFGQVDIKGSSDARNVATTNDLILQLKHVSKIIKAIYEIDPLPIYEQINFRINNFLKDLKENLQVDSERRVLTFLRGEIIPLYDHLSGKNDKLKALIKTYYDLLDRDKGFIYKHRKDYDDSVMLINKTLANILDKKQARAQAMYPHYYERFKTDGVEHNIYVGESITKKNSFNKIYLYNLRLWQLQVMCEMENSFYKLKERLLVPLDVASMILVFNSSLSLRFRMDEKRFDVDGTYNARYEVVKKRVDKANIKGTDERITQPGKITIVYSQKQDENEYLKYISFLQSKKQLDTDVELLTLEDLQGVTGLSAIRVSVLYTKGKKDAKKYYTYDDLMKELNV